MNKNQLIRSGLTVVAVFLCLWGFKGVLTRPSPGGKGSSPASRQETSFNWTASLPASPVPGLAPSLNQPAADTIPTDLRKTTGLKLDGREITLELLGGSAHSSYGSEQSLYLLRSIRVWEGDSLLQTLTFDEAYFQGEQGSLWTEQPDFGLRTLDINFDSHTDFSVANCLWAEDVAGTPYSFHFVWDAENLVFLPFTLLDPLPATEFDGATRNVISTFTNTLTPPSITRTEYHYGEDQLEPLTQQVELSLPGGASGSSASYEWDGSDWIPSKDSN